MTGHVRLPLGENLARLGLRSETWPVVETENTTAWHCPPPVIEYTLECVQRELAL